MPIYEYRCAPCKVTFQRLVRGFTDPSDLSCPRCHTSQVTRVVSRVAHLHGDQAIVDRLSSDQTFAGVDESDPQSVARWAKELGRSIGEDAGADWDEMVDEMIDQERDDARRDHTTGGDTDLGWM